jgi:peptide/histidine transporter 3/4
MNNISWSGAVPNYILIALAECLVNVTGYDIFYSEVPLSLKSTSQALNMFMNSPGNILTSVFTIMFSGYLPTDNLNDGHLEYMFFTVAAVSVVNIIAFVYFMKKLDFAQVPGSERRIQDLNDEKLSVLSRSSAVVNK